MASPAEVRAYIEKQARASGLSENDVRNLLTTAQKESSMGQNVSTPKSTAKGVFQFTNSTGAQYGLNGPEGKGFDTRLDYKKNIDAGIRFYKDNQKAMAPLLKAKGIAPDDATAMYLAHQQGVKGARQIYNNLGTGKTINQILDDKRARNNGMDGMTADEALKLWGGKADRFAQKMGLGARTPTMASAPSTTPPPPITPYTMVPSYFTKQQDNQLSMMPVGLQKNTPFLFQAIPPAPVQPPSMGLSSTLLGPPSAIPTPEAPPEDLNLASVIKRASDISGNKGRAGLGTASVDPMTYDIMKMIENS